MRTGTTGGYRAAQYDHIEAPKTSPGFVGKALFCVMGLPGMWRRVNNPKVDDPNTKGVLPAFYDGGIIYLTPDGTINAELAEGGIAFPDTPGGKIVADLLNARLRPSEPAASGFASGDVSAATEPTAGGTAQLEPANEPLPATNPTPPEPADGEM